MHKLQFAFWGIKTWFKILYYAIKTLCLLCIINKEYYSIPNCP